MTAHVKRKTENGKRETAFDPWGGYRTGTGGHFAIAARWAS